MNFHACAHTQKIRAHLSFRAPCILLMYMYKLFPTQNMCCQARAESELAALRKQVENLNQEKIRMDKFTMGGDSSPSLRGWDDSSVPSENNERTRRSRRQQPSQKRRETPRKMAPKPTNRAVTVTRRRVKCLREKRAKLARVREETWI